MMHPLKTPAAVSERHGTFTSSVATLCASAMGAGILSLPIAVYYAGWALGTALLLAYAVANDASLVCIVRAAAVRRQLGGTGARQRPSLESLAEYFYGARGRRAVQFITISLIWGAMVVLLIVAADALTPGVQYVALGGEVYSERCEACPGVPIPLLAGTLSCRTCLPPPWYLGRGALSVCIVVGLFPLTLFRELSKLSATSWAALASLGFVLVAMLYKFAVAGVSPSVTAINMQTYTLFGISVQGMAFMNQFNVLGVLSELPRGQEGKMTAIIHTSMLGIVAPVYVVAGLAGYLQFGAGTSALGDIINGFPAGDTLMLCASAAVGICNILKFPLFTMPLRDTLNSLVGWTVHASEAVRNRRLRLLPFWARAGQMLVLVLTSLCTALVLHNLAVGFQLLGATVGITLALVTPGFLGYAAATAPARINTRRVLSQDSVAVSVGVDSGGLPGLDGFAAAPQSSYGALQAKLHSSDSGSRSSSSTDGVSPRPIQASRGVAWVSIGLIALGLGTSVISVVLLGMKFAGVAAVAWVPHS